MIYHTHLHITKTISDLHSGHFQVFHKKNTERTQSDTFVGTTTSCAFVIIIRSTVSGLNLGQAAYVPDKGQVVVPNLRIFPRIVRH